MALDAALSVRVLLAVVVAGLYEADTPLGRPDADSVTFPLKPVLGSTVTIAEPLAPWSRLIAGTLVLRENLDAEATVRVIATVAFRFPDCPATVTVVVPVVAPVLAVKLNTLVVDVLAGPNDAVTPAGRPVTVRFTELLNPFVAATVMVAEPVPPWLTLTAAADVCRV